MTLDGAFLLANASVLPGWLLLAAAPASRATRVVVHSMLYPALLGAVYTACACVLFLSGGGPEGAGMGSLPGVMKLFSMPLAAFVGWVHYLVFDLFVGAWQARDARRHGIPHALLLPCLALTLMLGPAGLLLYLLVRLALRGRAELAEARAA